MSGALPPELRYEGEPVPRRRWVALLLTVVMPGLGHVYAGDFRGGVTRYLVPFFMLLFAVFLWRVFLFQPHLPLLVVTAAGLVYVGVLLREVWDLCDPDTTYVLQPYNHPLVYAGLLLLCHAMPVGLLVDRGIDTLVGRADVRDGAMFPMLFIGDQVLIDRTAFRSSPPERGALVVMRPPEGGGLVVRRVLAGPSMTVSFEQSVPVVDGVPLHQAPLGLLNLAGIDNRGKPPTLHLEGRLEVNEREHYTVTHRPDSRRLDREPQTLTAGEVYVLADNRDDGRDSRDFGPVSLEDVVGRPLYVWWSRDPDVGVAWHRIGLAAR